MVTKTTIAETLKEVMAKKDIKLTVAESNLYVTTVFQAVKNALVNAGEAAAWSMGAFMSLNVATECHADAIKAVARQWGGQAIRMAKPLPRFRPHGSGKTLGQRAQGLLPRTIQGRVL